MASFKAPVVRCAHDRLVPITDLKPHPDNPNTHPKKQIELLAKVIKEQGWRLPVVVSKRSGFVVAGHGRLLSAQLLGLSRVPVNYQVFESDEQELAHLAADNQLAELAEMDKESMRKLLKKVDGKIDLELTGMLKENRDDLFAPPKQHVLDAEPELPGARALKTWMHFDSKARYQIPEMRADMLGEPPLPLKPWIGLGRSPESDHYMVQFGGPDVHGLDFTKALLHFYTDDERFDVLWSAPDQTTTRLLNRAISVVVAPNYSLWADWPTACKIYSKYRSNWCARYMQEAGIRVIPDVNWAEPESFEYCLEGIPRKAKWVATQCQNISLKDTVSVKRCQDGITRAMKELAPENLLVYAGDHAEELLKPCLPRSLGVVYVQSALIVLREKLKARKNV